MSNFLKMHTSINGPIFYKNIFQYLYTPTSKSVKVSSFQSKKILQTIKFFGFSTGECIFSCFFNIFNFINEVLSVQSNIMSYSQRSEYLLDRKKCLQKKKNNKYKNKHYCKTNVKMFS